MAQYTKDQAIDALNAAASAGDNSAANEWAVYLDNMETTEPKAPEEEKSIVNGLMDSVKGVPKLAFDTARAFTDAATFGSLDEMASGLTAGATVAKDMVMGNEEGATFGEIYDAQMKYETEDRERFAEEHAALSTGAEITGMILSPINKALGAVKVLQAGTSAVGNVAKQGATGIATAVPYVFLTADGTIAERADVALSPTVAVSAAAFGIVGGKVVSVGKNFFTNKFKKSLDVPTVENLKAAKNELYDKVAAAGIKYSPASVNKSINMLVGRIQDKIAPTDTQAVAVFNMFKSLAARNSKSGTDLKQLDKLQKDMWMRYNSTGGNKSEKTIILDAINAVDDLIAKHPSNAEVMQLARAANSRFMKADSFDRLHKKMSLEATFKNAPVVDQMKMQVNRILNDPRQSKFYDDIELQAFEKFLADKGTMTARTLGLLKKAAPNMQISTLLAVGTGGSHLGAQAAGHIVGKTAKKFGDMQQGQRNIALMNSIRSGKPQVNTPAPVNSGLFTGVPTRDVAAYNEEDKDRIAQLYASRQAAR